MTSSSDDGALAVFQGRTILVAEDEYFLATEIRRRLVKAGAEVVGPFPTVGEAAAAAGNGGHLDAALLDINLRGEMVYPLAESLQRAGTPLVFMTGYDRVALPPAYRDLPVCDKPVDLRDVAHHLAALHG